MSTPSEHKTVQARILAYAQEIGWRYVPRAEAEARMRERWRNVYEVTEEFDTHNGKYGTREDVVFLINGIPVAAIECKNASKDAAIALGVVWKSLMRAHRGGMSNSKQG